MCGIVGLFTRKRPILQSDEEQVQLVLKKLSYRGPDGFGMWKSERILLGHRRLSIIDLSDAGAQPFEIPEMGLIITFNGEIYNFMEIRDTLASHGYTFRSHSDTEVMLYAYDHYGTDFLSHLKGMFAFCLLDQKRNVALLARDSAGEKPLYYYMDSARLLFASEIKAFHAFSDMDLSIDVESVKAFFALQYIPGPHTIYSRVRRLYPGSALLINLGEWATREIQFWSIAKSQSTPSTPEEMEDLLQQSIRYRLVADVEVGLLLSGGIDSALLAFYASKNAAKLRVFTARFDEEDLDESSYARQVSKQLDLQQVVVTGGKLTPEIFDQVIFHGDELLGDPACVPTFLLSREIANHVKVVLSGEGADELFWGYDTYRLEKIWRWFSWLNSLLSRFSGFQESISGWDISNGGSPMLTRMGKVLSAKYNIGVSRWTSVFADHTLNALISVSSRNDPVIYLQEMEQRIIQLEQHMNPFDASLSMDLLYWLADDLLMKVDRMTMAHGVEARAPYLDSELMLRALALPQEYKLRGKAGKLILRKLVEKHFPGAVGQSLAWRRKHGFEVPVDTWLRNNLRECVEDRLSVLKLSRSGLLEVDLAMRLKEDFFSSPLKTPLRRKLWMLLCFQSWYEMHETGFGFR